MTMAIAIPDALTQFLYDQNLVSRGEDWRAEPLTGGVSSDIWKITSGDSAFCVKAALAKLRTAQDWYAPISRNQTEVDWFLTAGQLQPKAVPTILAHDADAGMFAMAYLPPKTYPVWKAKLASGDVDVDFAGQVGAALSNLHGQTAADKDGDLASRFATHAQFHELRLSPYLWHLVTVYPELDTQVREIVGSLEQNQKALVHGDVSPKNILAGPYGPVFLDAETATYGDPVFDLAFCANHLLLKMIWVPSRKPQLRESFDALTRRYLEGVNWEDKGDLEARAAQLLPALLLARIDGKSPVEYITEPAAQARVRRAVMPMLRHTGPRRLADIAEAWEAGAL